MAYRSPRNLSHRRTLSEALWPETGKRRSTDMPNRVGIVGVGSEGFRPVVADLSTREMMYEAAARAYDDASVEPRRDVDSFVCCTEDLWEGWSIADEMVPDQIGGQADPCAPSRVTR